MDLVKFVEIYEDSSPQHIYFLREVYVNRKQVATIREDPMMHEKLIKGKLPEGLDSRTRFTKLEINLGGTFSRVIRVVGDLDSVSKKINWGDKNVL